MAGADFHVHVFVVSCLHGRPWYSVTLVAGPDTLWLSNALVAVCVCTPTGIMPRSFKAIPALQHLDQSQVPSCLAHEFKPDEEAGWTEKAKYCLVCLRFMCVVPVAACRGV